MRLFALFFALLITLVSAQVSATCEDYLLEKGAESVGVRRVESLLGRNIEIIDVSDYVAETRAKSEPDLRIFKLDDVFSRGVPFLGFGKPNVFLAVPRPQTEDGKIPYEKFAAKSLKRGDSHLVDTRGRVQSGLLLVFKNVPQEKLDRLYKAAQQHEGTRQFTCVNANCRVMKDAGFTIGGESLDQYYFPIPLLKDILQYGLELDGVPVEYDVVRTSPSYLEDLGFQINKAVWLTLCRHAERSCKVNEADMAKNTFLVRVKTKIGRLLGVYLNEADSEVKPVLESQIVRLPDQGQNFAQFTMDVSEPSEFGALLRVLWGPHSLFEIANDLSEMNTHLPTKLKAYPDEKPSFATKLKKNFLFSKPVVSLLRSQMAARNTSFDKMTEKHLYDMIRTNTDQTPNRYNIVATGEKTYLTKVNLGWKYADWILTKHVLVADYSDDVRFAGEMWKDSNGVIHISNNSGTFKPSCDQVQEMVQILRKKFPNISFAADCL